MKPLQANDVLAMIDYENRRYKTVIVVAAVVMLVAVTWASYLTVEPAKSLLTFAAGAAFGAGAYAALQWLRATISRSLIESDQGGRR